MCISTKSNAQNAYAQLEKDLKITFLKDSLEAEENSFLFNNVSLLYTGRGSLTLGLSFSSSPLFTVLSSAPVGYIELQSNQQQILPIRYSLNKGITSTEWLPFIVSFLVKQTGQTIEKNFWTRQKAFTKWKCFLQQPNIVIKEGENKTDFWVLVENSGNTADEYEVEYNSELAIEISKSDRRFVLQSGQRKMLKATAQLNFQKGRQLKNESITIYIKNKTGERKALYQKLNSIGHIYSMDVYQWKKMPLAVEFGAQTSYKRRMYYTTGLSGTLNLDNGRSLSLLFKTTDFNNTFKTNNTIATAEYATKDWRITGGTIVDFNHFLINGNGLRLKHVTASDGFIELAGINSPLYGTNQMDFKMSQAINRKLSVSNNSFINLDAKNATNSYLTVNKLNWKINARNTLVLEGGAGTEHIKKAKIDTTLTGSLYGYRFESYSDKLFFVSSFNYYSKNFPGFNKGFEYHNHELKFKLNKYFISGFYQADQKIFTSPEDSALMLLFNTSDKEFGIRSGYQFQKFSANLSAGVWQQQQDSAQSIVSRMMKVSSSINWMPGKGLSFSLLSNAGYVYLQERPDIGRVFVFNHFVSMQASSFGTHFRYDSGPFYYYEVKQYAQQQQSFKRFQVAPFFDRYLKRINTAVRLQVNYTFEKPNGYNNMLLTSQLLFSPPKLNMDLGLLSQVDLKNNASPLINFTIRKRLQLPVIRNNDSYYFKLFLFKDVNGNNIFDEADEMIPQANVLANKNWLETDINGVIDFKNISKETISLDFSKITHLRGWMPTQGYVQTVVPEKSIKKIWVPFKKSKEISGRLVVIADESSSATMDLSNIRVTASDGAGNKYSTLTDVKGEFYLGLPAGSYLVSVNEHVFDQNFKPLEFSKSADLIHNNSIHLTFEIIQKKRQINIRKSE